MSTAHLLGQLLPLKSAQLGRLVLNARRPNQDFIDPEDGPPAKMKFTKNPQTHFKETREFSKNSSLKPRLSNIITFTYEKKNSSIATLSAPQATTYDLENSGAWFENACGQADIRQFLERAVQNSDNVYLIVGFRTVSDGSLVKHLTNTSDKAVRLQAPFDIFPTGAASTTPLANVLNPGARSTQAVKDDQELVYIAPGEQIFAVLYRKVKFKWFSRKRADNMTLEANNRWKSVWDWRGPEAPDDDLDIIEATLTDLDDLDISDEESDNDDDETGYLRQRSSEKRNPSASVSSENQSAGVNGPIAQLTQGLYQYREVISPSPNLSSYLLEHHGIKKISVPDTPPEDRSIADWVRGGISKLLKIEYWCGLIFLACLFGGLSIYLGKLL